VKIFTVLCPKCKCDFYADMLLYTLNVQLHCPSCGLYFFKEESPRMLTGGAGASAVAQVAGGLTQDMLYRPPEED
jgi:hypothetical protein